MKNAAGMAVLAGLILCTAEAAPDAPLLDIILWHGGCLAAACLAAIPLNRICEVEERAERILRIRQESTRNTIRK